MTEYTVDDYNVTIRRGFVREDGMKLWGIRRYKGEAMLDWRDQKTYARDEATKDKARDARHTMHRSKVAAIKVERGCECCGLTHKHWKKMGRKFSSGFHCYLQFDHIDPESKLHNVCDMMGRAWKAIQAEIDKCRVVCFKCHVLHTAEQRKQGDIV